MRSRAHLRLIVVPAIGAGALLLLLVALDFFPPSGSWYGRHPMTSAALSSAVLFVAASMLLTGTLRERLAANGFDPSFEESSGSWRHGDSSELDRRLRALVNDREFVRELFRTTALMRRRLQEVTARWAPVMLVSSAQADDLGLLRDLTDALEVVQERLRLSGIVGTEAREWTPDPAWTDNVSSEYWAAISSYETIRDSFGDLARLPSDTIIGRRRER